MDGNWSEWGDWSSCSLTCGVGVQNRSRTCTNPSPAFGGASCPGDSSEPRFCNEDPCPGKSARLSTENTLSFVLFASLCSRTSFN